MEPLRMNCTASVPLPRIFDTTSEHLALVKTPVRLAITPACCGPVR